MDELGALILGKAPETSAKQPTEKSASVITDQLLDSLRRVESGKDRFAINKETKAMGPYQFLPETVQMLHKQGIEFNPFNEEQSRAAAKTYLEQLVQRNKGDVNKALAQYGGFITKDPTSYVNKVTSGAQAPQAPQAAPEDDLGSLILGKPQAKPQAQPQAQPQVQPSQAPIAGPEQIPTGGLTAPAPQPTVMGQLVNRFMQPQKAVPSMVASALEARQKIGERVAGGIDTLYGVVPQIYGAGVQALARTANTPERAEQIGQAAAASIDKPLGRALGITGKETYQQPLGGITEPIAKELNRMFNVLGMTPEQISEKTGIPAADIRNMVVIGGAAVPQALREAVPVAKQAAQAVAKPIREAAAEIEIVKPLSKEQAQAQFEARKVPAGSAGAAAVQNNPYFGKFTGEETGGRETFPAIKLTKTPTDVPVSEQKLRSELFQEVLPGLKPRPGVVTGNENLLRNEHALANMADPSELGLKMKQQIANEQIGLSKFAEDRVNATGASRSLINDEQRGGRINDVFHGVDPNEPSSASITGYLNQAKKQVYDSAFERVGNNQIKTTHVDDLLKNPQWAAGLKIKGVEGVQAAAKEYLTLAKTVGFEDLTGKMHPPGSVAAYDAVRKAMNAEWSPQNSRAIQKVNEAIDKDIAAVADPKLYKLGDKIHQVEKTILGSSGINKLFGEVDVNNVLTSSTPLEKIPSKLNNLPKDQWRHIRDTLSELAQGRIRNAPEGMPPVPQELRQSAAAAVAEIDGALAREVYAAGTKNAGEWSSQKANNVLNSVIGQKIVETFPLSEVQKFHALNYVGHYTPPLKYEGAALQGRRVGLIEKGLPAAGATVGTAIGALVGEEVGAGAGAFIGREAGARMQAARAAKAEVKAAKKMEKEMEKAAKLGQQTGKNKLSDM